MAPPSFRLDHLAVLYISRLEATRRAKADDPVATTESLRRVTAELVEAQAAECVAILGDHDQAQRIRREGMDTFLPRYTRLALEENAAEAKGGPVPDNLAARMVCALLAVPLSLVLSRLLPNPLELLYFLLPVLAPFLPEAFAWSARRRYQSRLQELTDDLGQLQDADEKLAPVLSAATSEPPARAPVAPAQPVGGPPPRIG